MYYALFDSQGNRITSYHTDVHDNIPVDAIPISDEDQALFATSLYSRGVDGRPVKKPTYVPTTEDLLVVIRAERNRLLADCDWTQLPDSPLSAEQKQAYAVYRQALREMPETCSPANPVWPETAIGGYFYQRR